MDRLTITTAVVLLLLAAKSLLGGADRLNCENVYFGELDQLSLIECNVTDSKLFVYWFKGRETDTYPIVSYEAGKIQWREGSKDKYDLTDEHFLKIIDTKLIDESNYTVRIYFDEFDYETVTTELKVYGRPDAPCLHIDSCDSNCDDCHLNITSSGELICHVNGSRPRIDLEWIVTNQSGISFVYHKQDEQYDKTSFRYHTTRTITYTADGCGGTASLYCNASVSEHSFNSILDVNSRNVRISSDTCKYIIPGTTKPPSEGAGGVVLPFIILAILFLAAIVFLVVCFIRRRRGNGLSHGRIGSEEYTELRTTGSYTSQEPRKPKDVKKELIEALIKYYEQYCFIKPLPWGEPIPISKLYTACDCTVTTTNKPTSRYTSEYLTTPEFNFDSKRVFITADLGYGKTTFTQHLVETWVSHQMAVKGKKKSKIDDVVLIYLHLKEVKRTTLLSEVVQGMLPAGNNLTCKEIEQIFQTNECHILLDGLDELSMSSKTEATSKQSSDNTTKLTIGILLDNMINMNIYKQLWVWVTSREVDDMKSGFSLPYSKVKMLGFSQQQINDYISKTCRYYYEQHNVPEMALFVQENADNSFSNTTSHKGNNQPSETTEEIRDSAGDMQKNSKDTKAIQNDFDVTSDDERKESTSDVLDGNENPEEKCEPTVKTKLLEEMSYDEQDSNKLPPDDDSNKCKRRKDENNDNERKESTSEVHDGNRNTEEKCEPTVTTTLLEEMQNDELDSSKFPSDGESNESKRKKDEMSTEKEDKKMSAPNSTKTDKKDHEVSDQLKLLENNVSNFMEVNDIINIFSETPLLQIMIIHIITCRMLDPTGRYKEVNMNKLTTVIRLVITCLESRYVQKVRNDSIKHDIKTLESKLGEIAFKNKLKVTLGKREFWNSELGDEKDVRTALEIGLLKFSKGAGSGGNQLEELAFSSYSGIEFYHEFFKEYLAAQYISENNTKWKWLDEFIKGSGDEATVRLLQFMFGMNNPKLDKVFRTLLNEKTMRNNLIDCIYEVGDPKKKKSMLADFYNKASKGGANMVLNVHYLNRKHHKVAVTDFCKSCNEHQINIRRMTFREACVIDFLQKVTLPTLQMLVLLKLVITEKEFVSIIKGLTGSERRCPDILLFVECEVPKTLTGKEKDDVAVAMENKTMKSEYDGR